MVRKAKKTADNKTEQVKKAAPSRNAVPSEEDTGPNSFDVEYRSRCGGALRTNREKLGLTTQEIASRLRLSSKQIEALEADNFAALPEATIVKGFIRNYAKLLKIPTEPLLDAYNVIVPEKAPQSFTLHSSVNMKVTEYEKPGPIRYVLLGLAVILCLGAWLFYESYVQKPNPVTPTAELPLPGEVTEPLPEAALPAAERSADQTVTQLTLPEGGAANAQTPTQETATTNSVATVPETAPSGSPLAPQPPVQAPADQSAATRAELTTVESSNPEPINGKSRLEFNASQETWVSVTDANGNEIYNRILFAGNREMIEAKPPLSVVVGNALGATLTVNGKQVELAPHTRTNVARVKID